LKISVFGLTISSSWGNGHATPYRAILRALHRRGHEITFFEKDVEYYYWRRDFTSCDYCDLVLYASWEDVRSRALAEAAASDVVIVGSYCPEGALISDEVLLIPGPLHVFYDLDTPITIANLKSGDLDYLRRDQMNSFDLYLSFTGGRVLDELETEWHARLARPLYGCVDPDTHARVAALEKFRCDLSYMGTYAADRQHRVDGLFVEPARLMPEASFVLAGTLYPETWTWTENVRRFDHIAPADHPALYSSSRATLNVTRDGMARRGYCPSGRFFEAAACGTAILSDWFEGLESFFRPGEEILIVGKAEDVISALKSPDNELSRIAHRARERVFFEHTGDARAEQLLRYLEEARRPARTELGTPIDSEKSNPIEVGS
jgi:spore maturation protein CgeB